MCIVYRRSVIAVTVVALGWFNGFKAYANCAGAAPQPQNANSELSDLFEQAGHGVTAQSLINLADEIQLRDGDGVIDASIHSPVASAIPNNDYAEPRLFWEEINIASTFPRHPASSDFNDLVIQLAPKEINLVPLPPAIFTGALTLTGMIVVKGFRRLR